ncbi:hypothetical protein FNF27_01504 [Cafeteria roenbergensis]|nr:hypothetical protein FNF31_06274 [Cafeteria roenbergensis]KAA0167043.1 hypothetical protein FNF28_02966 [Cafeteria roenbergensis]KAA0177174.1 hypothetical protein FNF27_01504 [Cafeteria roenbergensis]
MATAVRAASSSAVAAPAAAAAAGAVPSWARNLSGQGAKGKVVLLYSGGLDTSCILLWLLEQGYDVHAYVANLGQEEDFEAAREKATKIGAAGVHIEDLREDFLTNYIYPSIQCNAMYENLYLLGTSIARPCISKRAVEIAKREGCDFVSHGATGKGNDQVRFELSMYALAPHLKMIVPWRDPSFFERFQGRSDLLAYAADNGLPVVQTKAKPYSMDENMFHISYEAGVLEDPANAPSDDMFRLTTNPEDAPDTPEYIAVTFDQGIPVKVENIAEGHERTIDNQLEAFLYLNEVAGRHGVGRVDVVENRFVGMKSRGIYETPAGEVLRTAHIGLEGLTLDREVFKLRDMYSAKFAEYCYNGFWFSPEMDFVLKAVKESQKNVSGRVVVKLFKGRASIHTRESPVSLYDKNIVSMDVAGGYNPADAEGFIRINSLRLKAHAAREKSLGRTL